MPSIIGKLIKVSVFGESHGPAIGAVIDGLPSGIKLDMDKIYAQMERRAPGRDKSATPRKESDTPQIMSGVLEGYTTGMPLCVKIDNADTRSSDYSYLKNTPRPSHADWPASVRYGEHFDIRGSGHFSGRLTAPIVFAGAVCRQILEDKGITVGGHISGVGGVMDTPFDPVKVDKETLCALYKSSFAVIDSLAESKMREAIEAARLDADSIGGEVEIAVTGLPAGIGEPMARGVEGVISQAVFAVPAVKGIEFGAGFKMCSMRGSEANDCYTELDGKVGTLSNNNGGILGGLTTSMPIIMRVAIKPTPSIGMSQQTLNINSMEPDTLCIKGRHDPCIVPRALPVIEAAVCIALCDLMKEASLL